MERIQRQDAEETASNVSIPNVSAPKTARKAAKRKVPAKLPTTPAKAAATHANASNTPAPQPTDIGVDVFGVPPAMDKATNVTIQMSLRSFVKDKRLIPAIEALLIPHHKLVLTTTQFMRYYFLWMAEKDPDFMEKKWNQARIFAIMQLLGQEHPNEELYSPELLDCAQQFKNLQGGPQLCSLKNLPSNGLLLQATVMATNLNNSVTSNFLRAHLQFLQLGGGVDQAIRSKQQAWEYQNALISMRDLVSVFIILIRITYLSDAKNPTH